MTFYTSAEAMRLEEFIAIVANHGWTVRPAKPDETEVETDLVFENGDEWFPAWQEGDHIGANDYPSELEDVVCLYAEGTTGYMRVNGMDEEEDGE